MEVVNISEIKLRGISKQFTGSAKERFKQEYSMWVDKHGDVQNQICKTSEGVWYGIWNNGVYSIAKKDENVDNPNLETIIIPSGKYALFHTEPGGYAGDELPKLRKYIFDNWLPNSLYKQIGDFEVEVYHLYPENEKHKRHYEIWLPIK